MPRLLRSPRGSEEGSTRTSLVESIRRATNQPTRQSKKPYSKGEEAGSSRRKKSTAPHLPIDIPEFDLPVPQLNSYSIMADPSRDFQSNPACYSYQPESIYPYESIVTNNQEWSMTPPNSMSPATSAGSQPLLDSPASGTTNPWVPFIASSDSRFLQQDGRVGYALPYSNLFNSSYRYSQPSPCTDEYGFVSSAIEEEIAETYVCLDERNALSPLHELGLRSYAELDDLTNVLTWEVVDEGKPLPF